MNEEHRIERVGNMVFNHLTDEAYCQALLTAFKAGMTEAANIINKHEDFIAAPISFEALREVKKAILTARDNKTTI